jgi:flagellar biosynthesis protein FlhB
MADSSEEKTEKPTPHRLKEARKKGQVAKSTELAGAISLLVGCAVVILLAAWMPVKLAGLYLAVERSIPGLHSANVFGLLIESFYIVMMLSVLPLIVVAVVGTLATGIQAGPVFSIDQVKPKFERMNPAANLKRLFSLRTLVQFALMVLKLLIIGAAMLLILKMVLPDAIELIHGEIGGALAVARRALMLMVLWCGGLFVMLGLMDYAYQRWQFLKEQRMSHQEIKREHREQEGDPLIKGMRKSLAEEPPASELLEYVPRCTVVIAEPGGRAVALFYRRGAVAAPMAVVRGAGDMARDILERARKGRVAIHFDAVLLDRIYGRAAPGAVMPEEVAPDVMAVLPRQGGA